MRDRKEEERKREIERESENIVLFCLIISYFYPTLSDDLYHSLKTPYEGGQSKKGG